MTGKLTVNGAEIRVEFSPDATLLDVLRANGHTEVKRGCSSGECGSCLVHLDGKLVNSCQVFAATTLDSTVTTSLGLTENGSPHIIQEAFVEMGAVQCGFCTPGMVLATHTLLEENPEPSEEEIAAGLAGNLCRCTGYVKIVDAVELAAKRMREDG